MKAPIAFFLLSFISILLLLTSCSVEKRQHLSGYHIEWKKKKEIANRKNEVAALNNIPVQIGEEASDFTASVFDQPEIINKNKPEYQPFYENSIKSPDCDTIKKKDGTRIFALITGTTENIIMYKKCYDEEGTIYTLPKFLLHSVVFSNGEKEFYKMEKGAQKTYSEGESPVGQEPKVINKKAVRSFKLSIWCTIATYAAIILAGEMLAALAVFSIAFIALLFFIAATYFAISAIREIFSDRKKYKGFGFALAALIIVGYLLLYTAVGLIFIGV